ncbi:MAG: ABC transporter substrate-binding protein [Methanolinea sp.]|jgi:branched-chain amino acid transport system substrate-binding protein|nr:ABC transporter substrate-binding protein [Methanolinea sp.]
MKRESIFCIFLAICLTFLVLSSGCTEQQPAAQKGEIKIGVVASMTGPASTTGKDIWQSAELAAEEINARGGVYVKDLGRSIPIHLVQGDDESTREGGQKAVSKLITQDNVDLLVGGYSSAVVSAHQAIVAEYKVPYIISGGSSTSVSHRTDIDTSYMFFHRPNTDDSGEASVMFINEVIRPSINSKFGFSADRKLRMAVIYQDSPFGKGQLDAVKNLIKTENLPIEVVAEEPFKMGESDFRTVLTSVKSKNPDIIYAVTFLNELVPMTQQARRDVGLNTLILSIENNDDPDYYKGVGSYGDAQVMESRFSPYAVPKGSTEEATRQFLSNFDKKYGGFAGMMGAATYESVYVAAEAIEKAGSLEKAKIRDALANLAMPQMMEIMKGGIISFSPDFHESKFDLYVVQLAIDPASGEPRPTIVWPENLKAKEFMLPDWYTPGST